MKSRTTKFSIIFLFFVNMIGASELFAQTPAEVPEVIPPSPTVASLGKYGDVPVNLNHGSPGISIPLYNIVVDDITVPISLSFHASGHKVGEQASWVGLGWSLEAGGAIGRSMRGKPDEDGYFQTMTQIQDFEQRNMLRFLWQPNLAYYLPDHALQAIALIDWQFRAGFIGASERDNQIDQITQDHKILYDRPSEFYEVKNWMHTTKTQNYDTKADIYNYSYPGGSGKFMFKPDGSTIQIPYQNHRITPLAFTHPCQSCQGTLGGFQITDQQGISYGFSDKETTEVRYPQDAPMPDPNQYESAWHLSSITSQRSGKTVSFNYSPIYPEEADIMFSEAFVENIETVLFGSELRIGSISTDYKLDETRITNRVTYLDTISWESGHVVFVSDPGRFDRIDGKGRILKEVIIEDVDHNKIKSFKLQYNNGDSTIHTQSGNYLNNHLLLTAVQEVGPTGNTKPPYQIAYFAGIPARDSRAKDHDGFYNGKAANTHLVPSYYTYFGALVPGADRSPGDLTSRVGMVKSITYPTGGSTHFEYENHEIYVGEVLEHNTVVHTVEKCDNSGALFPNEGILGFNCLSSKNANLIIPVDAENIKINVTSTWGSNNPTVDGGTYHAKILDNTGATIYNISTLNNDQVSGLLQSGNTYDLQLFTDVQYTKLELKITYDTPAPSSNMKLGGLRLASITDYADGQAKKRSYTYENSTRGGGTSSGFPLTRIQPEYTIQTKGQGAIHRRHSSNPLGNFELFGGGQVVYLEVQEQEAGNGHTSYFYSNHRDDSDVNLMALPYGVQGLKVEDYPQSMTLSSSAWKRGHLIKQQVYNEDSTLMAETRHNYDYIELDATTSFSYEMFHDDLPPSGLFTWSLDKQKSGWARLNSSTTKTYENGQESSVTTTIQYDPGDSTFILPKVRTHQLDGINDYSENYAYLNDTTNHIVSPVTEIIRYDELDFPLSKENYTYQNGKVIKIEQSLNGNTVADYTTYLSEYNGMKPSFVQGPSGINTVYLWGYGGTLPVAKIVNVDYSTVQNTLGSNLSAIEGSSDSNFIRTQLLELKGTLTQQQSMNIYLHTQGVGIVEEISPNGLVTTYHYDGLNRLYQIKDQDQHVLKEFHYNYSN